MRWTTHTAHPSIQYCKFRYGWCDSLAFCFAFISGKSHIFCIHGNGMYYSIILRTLTMKWWKHCCSLCVCCVHISKLLSRHFLEIHNSTCCICPGCSCYQINIITSDLRYASATYRVCMRWKMPAKVFYTVECLTAFVSIRVKLQRERRCATAVAGAADEKGDTHEWLPWQQSMHWLP